MVEDIRFGLRSENLFLLLLFLSGLRSKFARRKWNSLSRLVGSYFFSLFDLIWFPLKQSDKDTNWPDLFCLFVRSSSCVPPVWWFQLLFFFLCVGRVQRPFHVTTQPKCVSFFIGRLAWNRTAEVSRVTLLSGTCVVFSFFLTCQNSTSNQRIFMNAIYSEKWRKTRTNYLKLKSPNFGKKLGEKTKKQQNFVRIQF